MQESHKEQDSKTIQNIPDFSEVAASLNLDHPILKPSDLEDLASVFDKIRVMYKRRDDNPFVGKVDELAI